MQQIERLLKKWEELREWRDVNIISEIIGLDHSQTSRILSGHVTTSTENYLKIKEFYDNREQLRKKLSA